jgi:hypothetical protein
MHAQKLPLKNHSLVTSSDIPRYFAVLYCTLTKGPQGPAGQEEKFCKNLITARMLAKAPGSSAFGNFLWLSSYSLGALGYLFAITIHRAGCEIEGAEVGLNTSADLLYFRCA